MQPFPTPFTNSEAQRALTRNTQQRLSYQSPIGMGDENEDTQSLSRDMYNINRMAIAGPQTVTMGSLYRVNFQPARVTFNPYNPLHFMNM